jgi:predicted Zn-dependent peptidase
MEYSEVALANGLRVVCLERPGTPTVATKVLVKCGSRHDGEKHGLAHALEHLFFKGTANRTTRQIYHAVEKVGGQIDAQTTKEYTAFSVVTQARFHRRGLEVLADIVRHPRLDEMAFLKEKLVILEEMRRRADQRQAIWDFYTATLWQTHPLKDRVLGYKEDLLNLTVEDLRQHHTTFFVPSNTVIAIAGNVTLEGALAVIVEVFGDWEGESPSFPPVPAELPLSDKREVWIERDVNQVHLLLGWPAVDMAHPDRHPLKVIGRLLGVGGSSRLYQRLREEQQLAYTVATATATYEDIGHFAIYTACQPDKVETVRAAILEAVARLREQPVDDEELGRVKTSYEGSLAVNFETNLKLASIHGVEALLDRIEPFEEGVRRINAVTQEDILRVAQRYLDLERYVSVAMGPKPATVA